MRFPCKIWLPYNIVNFIHSEIISTFWYRLLMFCFEFEQQISNFVMKELSLYNTWQSFPISSAVVLIAKLTRKHIYSFIILLSQIRDIIIKTTKNSQRIYNVYFADRKLYMLSRQFS